MTARVPVISISLLKISIGFLNGEGGLHCHIISQVRLNCYRIIIKLSVEGKMKKRENMSKSVSLAFPENQGQSKDEQFIFRTVTQVGAIDLYYMGSRYRDFLYGGYTPGISWTAKRNEEFTELVQRSTIVKDQFPLRLEFPGTIDFYDEVFQQIHDSEIRQLVEKSLLHSHRSIIEVPQYKQEGLLDSEFLAADLSQETMIRFANSLDSKNTNDLDAARSFLPHLRAQISMYQSSLFNRGYVLQKHGRILSRMEAEIYKGPNFDNPYPHYLINPIPNNIWMMGLKILADDFDESLVIFKTKGKYHVSKVTNSHDPYFYYLFYPINQEFMQRLEQQEDYIVVDITLNRFQKILKKLLQFFSREGFRLRPIPNVKETMELFVQKYGYGLDPIKEDQIRKKRDKLILELSQRLRTQVNHSRPGENRRKQETMSISYKRLQNLQPDIFLGFDTLEILDLSLNELTHLKNGTFNGLKNLKNLSLRRNKLQIIDSDVFEPVKGLTKLELNENLLNSLSPGLFKPLSQLTYLSLENNQITSLDPDLFRWITNLDILWLGNNKLTELPEGLFNNLSKLRTLTLQLNNISVLPETLFSQLHSIESIFVTRNQLSSIPENIFHGLKSLKSVHLSYNPIKEIPDNLFRDQPGIEFRFDK